MSALPVRGGAAVKLFLACLSGAVLLASAASSSASSRPSGSGLRVETLATIREPVSGFAQNRRYLAWAVDTGRLGEPCSALVMQDLRTRVRSTRRGCGEAAFDPGTLVLAGQRGYWEMRGSSNLTEFSDLMTASIHARSAEIVAFQSIYNEGSDHLVPPASDGRSAYFWTSPEDATPGPLVRFDGRRAKRLTPRISSLNALGAGEGRYAFALAIRTHDCAREPAWSPDGRLIAYGSGGARGCRGGLWVMNADGTGARRVAANGRNPDWLPDGSKLAYDDGAGAVVVSDATGGNAQTVLRGADPAWSPDGSRLAYEREQSIFVAAADGSSERMVTAGAVEPDWSPDGTKLVFARTNKAQPGLGIVNVDGTAPRSLTISEDRQPAWSPDGRTIAFAHCWGPHAGCPNDATQIVVVAPDGSGRRVRTNDSDETEDRAPAWAPDSQRLLFTRSRSWQDDGDSHIVTGSRRLTHTPAPRTPIFVRSHGGRPLATISPGGEAVSLAVTRSVTAALVRRNTWGLEIYSPKPRIVNLGTRRVARTLAASGRRVVFRTGRSIFVLDARSGRVRLVARAAVTPIGLSIVGRRIAWAENIRGGARVRAVTLR